MRKGSDPIYLDWEKGSDPVYYSLLGGVRCQSASPLVNVSLHPLRDTE